ncbi:MAG: extracellular solute-binding protein [Deltaproteobacteria bacterium]|nr:extracellular solute-binding protein [Deltaproteobacteria bacterium]
MKASDKKKGSYGLVMLMILVGFYLLISAHVTTAAEPSKELIEAAKREGELMYWGTDAETAPKFSKVFVKKYPFMKGKIQFWDAKSHEVVERIITEAKAGRYSADFISISEDWLNRLQEAGLLARSDWPNVERWGVDVHPQHGLWVNVAIDPRPAVYNTEMIPPSKAPKTLEGLINPKWKGTSALSDASEEFPFIFAYLWRKGNKLNWEKSFDFFRRLVKTTKPAVVRGYTGPTRLLVAGEFGLFHIGLFSRAYQMIKKGAPVGLVPVSPLYGSVRSFAIPKHAPNPNAAKLFAHWMTTTEGSITYANFLGKFPYDPSAGKAKPVKVAKKYGINRSDVIRIPTDAWNKKDTDKSADFYYRLLGIK